MKQIPILFSTEMVQAIIAGNKTQTRRIIKIPDLIANPDIFVYNGNSSQIDIPRKAIPFDDRLYHSWELKNNNTPQWVISSYKQGYILWVRETFAIQQPAMSPGDEIPDWTNYVYKADNPPSDWRKGKWKPSIFMPREACRLFLEVTDIRVERLQDISEEDAIKEGVKYELYNGLKLWVDYIDNDYKLPSAFQSYQTIWHKINGPGSWDKNDWVWVISFKKLDHIPDISKQ